MDFHGNCYRLILIIRSFNILCFCLATEAILHTLVDSRESIVDPGADMRQACYL